MKLKKVKNIMDYAILSCAKLPVERGKQRIYAVITDKKGRILSEASNDYESSCNVQRYYAKVVGMEDKVFNHAECLALQRIGRNASKAYRITVVRVLKNGETAISAPCKVCREAIKSFGIKSVEYSI